MTTPSEAQGELLPALAQEDDGRPLRGARAVAAVALAAIAELRAKVQAPTHALPHRAPCEFQRDERGRIVRDRSGRFLDPHEWTPADRPGWLICARCRMWLEVDEEERVAARFRAWLASARGTP